MNVYIVPWDNKNAHYSVGTNSSQCSKQVYNIYQYGKYCMYGRIAYVTEKGFPHTSNSINLDGHNFVFKKVTKLKIPLSINVCRCSLLTIFQGNTFSQSQVMNCQSL